MKVNQVITKEVVVQNLKKAIDIAYSTNDAFQFLVDTIANSTALTRIDTMIKTAPAGNIDALTVGKRKIRVADDDDGDTTNVTGNPEKRSIPYAVKKVFWDTWLKNDDVVYNSVRVAVQGRGVGFTQDGVTGGTDLETLVIQMIQKQFASDMQDLAFNGDTAAPANDPDHDFFDIVDGFIKTSASATNVTDIGTDAPTLSAFIEHIQMMPEKYKSNFGEDIHWLISRKTHDSLLVDITNRQTGWSDTVAQDGVIQRIGGYNVLVVEGLEGPYKNPADATAGKRGWACLTPLSNLAVIFTQNLKYSRTGEGATAKKRDSVYHILHAYIDVIIKEIDGIAPMVGDNL